MGRKTYASNRWPLSPGGHNPGRAIRREEAPGSDVLAPGPLSPEVVPEDGTYAGKSTDADDRPGPTTIEEGDVSGEGDWQNLAEMAEGDLNRHAFDWVVTDGNVSDALYALDEIESDADLQRAIDYLKGAGVWDNLTENWGDAKEDEYLGGKYERVNDIAENGVTEEATAEGGVEEDALSEGGLTNPFDPDDGLDHFWEVELHHPEKIRDENSSIIALIELAEDAIQRSVDTLGAGTPEKAPNLEELLTEAGVMDGESIMLDQFAIHSTEIAEIKEGLRVGDLDVDAVSGSALAIADEALKDIQEIVADLNDKIDAIEFYDKDNYESFPKELTDELTGALEEALGDVEGVMKEATEQIDALTVEDPEVEDGEETAEEAYARGVADGQANIAAYVPSATDDSLYSDLIGMDTTGTTGTSTAGTTGTTGTTGGIESLIPAILSMLTGGSGASAGTSGGSSGGGGGLDQMMMMLPMMMMGMSPMLMQMFNKDDEKKDKEEEEGLYVEGQSPPPGAPPLGENAVPPPVAAPAEAGPPPAAVVAGGMVDVRLPDGSTQKVSSAVAQALNKELSNPNGSDARSAYAGTTGESAPGHQWVTTDSSHLKTGDIVQWANRTALVVMTDAGLFYLSDGKLSPLDPNNPSPDAHGAYGDFQGFFHPTGTDLAAPAPPAPGAVATAPPAPPAPVMAPAA